MVHSGRGLIRLVFPSKCVICRRLLDISEEIEVCDECRKIIPFYEETPPPYKGENFDALVSLCRYEGVARRTIINYKFYGKEAYFRALAALLHEKLSACNLAQGVDMVFSVPLHAKRLRERGYNQAALLSSALAKKLGKPEMSKLLKRRRDTLTQSKLPGNDRYANVRGAFRFVGDTEICGKNILLVDDILTTGSTMGECSRVLKEAGSGRITAAVIATSRGLDRGDSRRIFLKKNRLNTDIPL